MSVTRRGATAVDVGEPEFDLVIRGGKLATSRDTKIADIGIVGEAIVRVGTSAPMRGKREINAEGLLVLPGGVDPHVHLSFADSVDWRLDDHQSGSRAALAGGITSVGNMTFVKEGEPLTMGPEREAQLVARDALADVFVHPIAFELGDASIEQAQSVWRTGHPSLKLFMSAPSFDRHFAAVHRLMRAAADASAMTLLHCEDAACVACCTELLSQQGRTAIRHFGQSRPPLAEVSAVQRAIGLCEISGCPIYVVHLSSAEALHACAEARARGLPVFVETRPLYLHLTEHAFTGDRAGLCVAQPPLRTARDGEALWAALFDGTIDTIGSDHVGWPREQKIAADHDITNLRPGVADLETMLPMLFSEGVIQRGMPIERFVALTAENAARLFGLYPRKGTIAEGSDADLVIWDPDCVRTVNGAHMQSRAGYSVYDGTRVQGWPRWTVRRGQIVLSDDGVIHGDAGSGRLLLRRSGQPPTSPRKPFRGSA